MSLAEPEKKLSLSRRLTAISFNNMAYKLKREKIKKKFVFFEEHIRKISRFGTTNKEEIVRINMNDDALNDKSATSVIKEYNEVDTNKDDNVVTNKNNEVHIDMGDDIDANKDKCFHAPTYSPLETIEDEDTPFNIEKEIKINIKKNKRMNLNKFKNILDPVIPEDFEGSIVKLTSKMSDINISENSFNMSNTMESALTWTMCVF